MGEKGGGGGQEMCEASAKKGKATNQGTERKKHQTQARVLVSEYAKNFVKNSLQI